MASTPTASLSAAQARGVALAAQGFSNAPRLRQRRPFDQALAHLHVLQIDSVNVFVRSHYVPVFSRHGAYDVARLDSYLWESGEFTEYWAHEAAFLRIEDRPLFGWRMADFSKRFREEAEALAPTIARVRTQLAAHGPQFVRQLESEQRTNRGAWWDWSDTKRAVEMLFATGEVVSVGRERFERRYALAKEALPPTALREVPRDEAQFTLIERAARSLGVATLHDLADYHRMKSGEAMRAVRALVEEGILLPVQVAGWHGANGVPLAAWLHRDARVPRRLTPNALLTPFDPVVWFRPRAERLFNFHYRIEIYTPKAKRQFGYYCLPLLVAGQMAGRIDLKADRAKRCLLVQAAWQEADAPDHTPEVAKSLLAQAATWQGLEEVSVTGVGNLPLPARFAAS